MVAEITVFDYAEPGVSSTAIFGLPADLLVWHPAALQPQLSGRAHVQFLTKLRSYYWELIGSKSVSNAQLLTLSRDLYKSLSGHSAATAKTAFQAEADRMTALVLYLGGSVAAGLKQEAATACEAEGASGSILGGAVSCASASQLDRASTALLSPFLVNLQSLQGTAVRDLVKVGKAGDSAATAKGEVAAAGQALTALDRAVQSLEPNGQSVDPFKTPLTGSLGRTLGAEVSDALSAIADAESVVEADGSKGGINPGAEASTAAGFQG
ncbi:MAG: hypothetical protein ACREN1_04935 [Candidatus Dormibacteria bacterium]